MPARGFTLVELVIVLAILAVTSAIALPRYANSVARYRVELAAERIEHEIRHARAAARATRSPVTLNLLHGDNRIISSDLASLSGNDLLIDLGTEPYRVDLQGDNDQIEYDAFGRSDEIVIITVSAGPYTAKRTVQRSGEVTNP